MGKSFNKNIYDKNEGKSGFHKCKKKLHHSQRNINKNLIKDDESKLKVPNVRHKRFNWYCDIEDTYTLNDKYNVGTKHEWKINKFTSQKELIQYYIDEKENLLEELTKDKLRPKLYYDVSKQMEITKLKNEILELKKSIKQLIRRNKNGTFKGHNRDNI